MYKVGVDSVCDHCDTLKETLAELVGPNIADRLTKRVAARLHPKAPESKA